MTDQDENEAITCKIEEQFTASDPTLDNVIKPPFEIDETQKIKLRFLRTKLLLKQFNDN